jgi:hypothetical protein
MSAFVGPSGLSRAAAHQEPLQSAEPLHQVNLVVPAWVGRRTAAFLVTEAGAKAGRLKGAGTEGHLVAATAPDLLLRRG